MNQSSNEKKVYEEPTVTMVKLDFSDRISASSCVVHSPDYVVDNDLCAS